MKRIPFSYMTLRTFSATSRTTAANNSLISWPAEPKRAYAEVARACRPVLASARIAKFRWRAGELFSPELILDLSALRLC